MVGHSPNRMAVSLRSTQPLFRSSTSPRAASLIGLAVMAVIVAQSNPSESSWMPPCVVHSLTGMECPGCGATRAAHHVLNGEVLQATELNLLLVLATPWMVWVFSRWLIFGQSARVTASRKQLLLISVGTLAFAVLRNLNIEPFLWLAATT